MSNALIIVPTYNEKENIEKFINEIFKHLSDINILIVDDDSPDGTGTIARGIADKDSRVSVLHRRSNRGRGFAGIDAFKEALKKENILYIMEMDADFSHDPIYIPQFLEEIKEYDIVIGSRFVRGGKDIERNFLRRYLSRTANFFIKRHLGLNVNDCSSGYRCFKRDVIASFDFDSFISKGPAIIEEVLYNSSLKRYRIKEIPIIFKARHGGRTKLGLVKLLKVFIDILLLKNINLSEEKKKRTKELKGFGFSSALALNILGFIMYYRDREHFIWFTGIGSINVIFAIVYPKLLAPLKRILDNVISSTGRLINAISLVTVFYLIFAPIGILLRILRKDILHQRIDKTVDSYWIKRKENIFPKTFYERMG